EGADVDEPQTIGPGWGGSARFIGGRRSEASGSQSVERLASVLFGCLEVTEDVLDQDHRGIDDDAEVHRTDGEQVCILPEQHQDDDAQKQRKGNIDAHNDGAAQVAKERPLDNEDEQAAKNEIVQYR